MKQQINNLILLLFILGMCFLMTISAKAQSSIRYFLNNESFTNNTVIELSCLTVSRIGYASVKSEETARKIFGKDCPYYINVNKQSDINKQSNILEFKTTTKGVLLVYYAKDNSDLTLNDESGVASESHFKQNSYYYGISYFIIPSFGEYTLSCTSTSACKVYGFAFMPGNVAAYNVKGEGDFNLIGMSCDNYNNLEKSKQVGNLYLEGWYKDADFKDKITRNTSFDSPSVIFAKWVRCVWDLSSETGQYDGIEINKGGGNSASSDEWGFNIFQQNSTTNIPYIQFTPQYDGELTVTFNSNSNDNSKEKNCIIGTALPSETEPNGVQLSSGTSSSEVKTVQAKLTKDQPYYVYTTTGNIHISKLQYTANATSAQVNEDGTVNLVTTEEMEGWRTFYDASNSYQVKENTNTKVYIVEKSQTDGTVKMVNRTGNCIPKNCPVILKTEDINPNGGYIIKLIKETSPTECSEEIKNTNLLKVSYANEEIKRAYRLGYRSYEDTHVSFYPWESENASAGIVYLSVPNSEGAKNILFEIEETSTAISSIRNDIENKIYSISGVKLKTPQKGINIINGKKIIVR